MCTLMGSECPSSCMYCPCAPSLPRYCKLPAHATCETSQQNETGACTSKWLTCSLMGPLRLISPHAPHLVGTFRDPKPPCYVQSTFELGAAAHLVGLDIGLPKLGVKAPAAGGRQRQQVVAQRPQLLLAEACPPASPMAEWPGPMSQDKLLKVHILKDMRVSGPKDSAVPNSQRFAGRQHIVQPSRSMTGAMISWSTYT